jgi:hypothetical protein
MEIKDVLPTYAKMISFGLCAGIFASAVYLIVYNLWFPVFNLVNTPDNISRLVLNLFIAGMHMFVMFALVPLLAGAMFIMVFYKKVSLSQLILANALATVVMGIVFYALTTYAISPSTYTTLVSLLANISVPAVTNAVIANYVMPMLLQVVEFIVWSSAGAFIVYLMIYRSWVNPKRNNLKHTGIVGLAVVSVAAIAPPAITYVATII